MWIPQGAATLGLLAFALSFVDDFVAVLKGERPSYDKATEIDVQGQG